MSADMLSWFTAFLIGMVVVLVMLIAVVLLPRVGLTRARTTRFFCPWAGREVTVRFLADGGRPPDRVMSCTAFADPFIVVCERRCLAAQAPADLAPAKEEAAVT